MTLIFDLVENQHGIINGIIISCKKLHRIKTGWMDAKQTLSRADLGN